DHTEDFPTNHQRIYECPKNLNLSIVAGRHQFANHRSRCNLPNSLCDFSKAYRFRRQQAFITPKRVVLFGNRPAMGTCRVSRPL
ncbi:MAG: hypothetical protein ACLQF2_20750, partial [Rhodomicrobium sp.]